MIAALVSIFVAFNSILAIYSFVRLLLLVGFLYLILTIIYKPTLFSKVLGVIGFLSVIQAVIGIFQFSFPRSLGLQILGESYLTLLGGPASKIPFEGGYLLLQASPNSLRTHTFFPEG